MVVYIKHMKWNQINKLLLNILNKICKKNMISCKNYKYVMVYQKFINMVN